MTPRMLEGSYTGMRLDDHYGRVIQSAVAATLQRDFTALVEQINACRRWHFID